MMQVVPFVSDHLLKLSDLGQQEDLVRPFLEDLANVKYENQGPAFSGFVGDEMVGCAGLVEMTPYRAYTWAIMPQQTLRQRFVAIHRAVKEFLDKQEYQRIDAHVALHDRAGHRWAKLLGFQVEVLCRPWAMPDGSSVTEYVRWKWPQRQSSQH